MIVTPLGTARFVTAYGIPEDIGRDAPAGNVRLWLVCNRYTNGYRPVRHCIRHLRRCKVGIPWLAVRDFGWSILVTPMGTARFVTAYGIPEDIGRDAAAGSTRLWLVYDRYTNGYRPVRYCLQTI